MCSSEYQYRPLNPSHIRLIRFYFDQTRSRLSFDFRHVDLNDLPGLLPDTYKAISYTWGDPAPVRKIWCSDDRYIQINKIVNEIAETAAEMGDLNSTAYFWIDFLCINQQDLKEKAIQVAMMGQIYAASIQVIAWLGRDNEWAEEAFQLTTDLLNGIAQLHADEKPITDTLFAFPGCAHPSSKWVSLRCLLRHPYFERIWVIQEQVMAPQFKNKTGGDEGIIVICGGKVMNWTILAVVMVCLGATDIQSLRLFDGEQGTAYHPGQAPGLRNIIWVYDARCRKRITKDKIYMHEELLKCSAFRSTDPRDKIYAAAAFADDANDTTQTEFYPDYTIQVEQLYTNTTRVLLMRDESLRILHLAGIGWHRSLQDLPSWVPDWSYSSKRHIFGHIAEQVGYNAARASPRIINFPIETQTMVASGIRIGTLTHLFPQPTQPSSPLSNEDGSKAYRRALADWVRSLSDFLTETSSPSATTHNDTSEIIWQTLTGNFTRLGGPTPKEEGSDLFHAWQYFNEQLTDHGHQAPQSSETKRKAHDFFASFNDALGVERVVFQTSGQGFSFLGLGPAGSHEGDVLCVLLGTSTPFLLRSADDDAKREGIGSWQLVGECYVRGLMDGQGLEKGQVEDFALI